MRGPAFCGQLFWHLQLLPTSGRANVETACLTTPFQKGNMPLFKCRVERHQVWYFTNVEADNENEARDKADQMASETHPNDDFAYETTAQSVNPFQKGKSK